jgi:mutator protein MutT
MQKTWQILEEKIKDSFPLFETKISKRKRLDTDLEYDFFLLNGRDWSNIIAVTDEREILLVRQYRHGIEEYTLELPGGCLEIGETPKDAIMRELEEETGYCAENCQKLITLHANPAMMNVKAHFFVANNLRETAKVKLDATEDITLVKMPIEEVYQNISSGRITHAIQVAALLFARDQLTR